MRGMPHRDKVWWPAAGWADPAPWPTTRPGRRRVVRAPALIPRSSQQPRAFCAASLNFALPRRESRLLRRVPTKRLPVIEALGPAFVWARRPSTALDRANDARKAGFPFYFTHHTDNVESLRTATRRLRLSRDGDLQRWNIIRFCSRAEHAAGHTLSTVCRQVELETRS
jgi:hypothetical protein